MPTQDKSMMLDAENENSFSAKYVTEVRCGILLLVSIIL